MTRDEVARLRAAHVPAARGVVLEVGVGSGLNLPFYTAGVTRLHAMDSSAELLAMARPKATDLPFPVEFLQQNVERIPLEDTSVDTVVVTWSLCSILDPASALREMRRVLKADGTFIFVEHGLAPDAGVRKWQNRLTPLWRTMAGGCHLNRPIDDLIGDAGFTMTTLKTEYIRGPRVATYMYEGRACR